MNLFNKIKSSKPSSSNSTYSTISPSHSIPAPISDTENSLALLALTHIEQGVAIVDKHAIIRFINPAGAILTSQQNTTLTLSLSLDYIFTLEDSDAHPIPNNQNPILHAIYTNQPFKSRDYIFAPKNGSKKLHLEISVIPTDNMESDRIITFRDITKELENESTQSEFISTASHEMRTPVASIEGYLSLALNPQTATIDERAKKYLISAQAASQHLGRLFQNLLDVTKLDDKKIKPHLVSIELTAVVESIINSFIPKFTEKHLHVSFNSRSNMRILNQPIFCFLDTSFLREIVENLLENAIKYTKENGSITVNVTSDAERAIISIADDGIGIPSTDIEHIFQKFYRVDNRDTREIGGTGLGLYIVKQRTEAMNGTVWVKSMYGKGSTFFVALPRISAAEYEKRKIIEQNAKISSPPLANQSQV